MCVCASRRPCVRTSGTITRRTHRVLMTSLRKINRLYLFCIGWYWRLYLSFFIRIHPHTTGSTSMDSTTHPDRKIAWYHLRPERNCTTSGQNCVHRQHDEAQNGEHTCNHLTRLDGTEYSVYTLLWVDPHSRVAIRPIMYEQCVVIEKKRSHFYLTAWTWQGRPKVTCDFKYCATSDWWVIIDGVGRCHDG